MRRIVSARDQVEMLSPWRTAEQQTLPGMPEPQPVTPPDNETLYRGLRVDPGEPGLEQIGWSLYGRPTNSDRSDVFGPAGYGRLQAPKPGPRHLTDDEARQVVDWINKPGPLKWHHNLPGRDQDIKNKYVPQGEGLGPHWTTDPEVAKAAATLLPDNLGVVMEAEHPRGVRVDPHTHTLAEEGLSDEQIKWEAEQRLLPGAPTNVKRVHIYHPVLKTWKTHEFDAPIQYTAAKPRRFTQDWQEIGNDYFPVDVISHYMQRKEEGFGDEKAPLYELNKQPPLSEQIKQRGYEKPIELATDGKSGSIYDGHHRIDIARQLGHTHIPVEVSWRTPHPDYPEGSYGNRIEPWLKGWLTDMRRGRETVGKLANADVGVNINDKKQKFTDQILSGEKTIETRDTDSLRKHVGKRLGIIRTGLGKAHVVGYATIGEPKLYTSAEEFDRDYELHRVDSDSDFHFDNAKYGVKYGYPLHDVEIEPNPYPVDSFGYVTRDIPRPITAEKSLEQHLRDTYENYPPGSPNLPDSLKPHLMLPTDIAHHYREYDRPDDENTQMLKRVIADQGIRQPLKISTDGTHAVMIEGNHRLNVARQLGMSHVPVQVFMEKPGEVMTNESYSKPVPLEPVLGNWIDKNRQHLKSFWS